MSESTQLWRYRTLKVFSPNEDAPLAKRKVTRQFKIMWNIQRLHRVNCLRNCRNKWRMGAYACVCCTFPNSDYRCDVCAALCYRSISFGLSFAVALFSCDFVAIGRLSFILIPKVFARTFLKLFHVQQPRFGRISYYPLTLSHTLTVCFVRALVAFAFEIP